MPKKPSNSLTNAIEKSVNAHVSAYNDKRERELNAMKKKFGKFAKSFPAAVEATGGHKAKELQGISQHLLLSSSAGNQRSIEHFAESYAPNVEKAFKRMNVDIEKDRKELLDIIGVKRERWSPTEFLSGYTGLQLSSDENATEKEGK